MRNFMTRLFVFSTILLSAVPAFATEEVAGGDSIKGILAIAASVAVGIAAFGAALGQGNAVNAAMQGIARNPSAAPKIMTNMIIGLAMMESLAIYGLVIALIIIFVM